VGFGVTYEAENNTIVIDSSLDYYLAASLEFLPDAYVSKASGIITYTKTDSGNISVYKYG
jgi:hypothetical protein